MEYNLINENISVKASTIIRLEEHFTLVTTEGVLDLKADISADLDNIPEKYHEVFMNMLTSKYLNKVSFGDNPFSQCKPYVRRKWWQFWKSKILSL